MMGIDQADLVQRTIMYRERWEPELTALFEHELRDDDVFYDVGANVGYFTCLALQKGVRHVVAFDPDPLNVAVLKLNLRLNLVPAWRTSVFVKGVSSSCGQLEYTRTRAANVGRGGFATSDGISIFPADVVSLDALIASGAVPPPTIVKIDVEGWEEHVFRGAVNTLSICPPRLIVFEADTGQTNEMSNMDLRRLIEGFGYDISLVERQPGSVIDGKENYVARRR